VCIAAQMELVAVGCADGQVHLYRLFPTSEAAASGRSDSSSNSSTQPPPLTQQPQQQQSASDGLYLRTLNLDYWGHKPSVTGGVSALTWAPDGRALAVGYSRQGVVVWSPSGCRFLCTIRQTAADTPQAKRPQMSTSLQNSGLGGGSLETQGSGRMEGLSASSLLEGSVQGLAWGPEGYQLLVAERGVIATGGGSCLVELCLAKALPNHHRVAHFTPAEAGQGVAQLGDELHVLQVRRAYELAGCCCLIGCICFLAALRSSS
jgi:WD40 repeat protein